MSNCKFNIDGEYVCSEQFTQASKEPLPKVNNNFSNINLCKSFINRTDNKDSIATLYNIKGNLPYKFKNFSKNYNNCDKIASARHINKILAENKYNIVSPKSTIYPNSDNVQNIYNKNSYNNKLFTSNKSICNIDNKYITFDNNKLVYNMVSGLGNKQYCFMATEELKK